MLTKRRRHASSLLTVSIAAGLLVAALGASATYASKTAGTKKLSSILFVNPLPDYPQWKLIGQCMSAQAKTLGIPYTQAGTPGVLNPVAMVQQIQTGIANKAGAIVTFPASPAFGPVLQHARAAGIVTGTYYGGGGSATGQFNAGVDWNALAVLYAGSIAQRPGVQHVGVLSVSPTGIGKAWVDGWKLAVKKYSNIKISAIIYTADDPAKTLSEVNALLIAHPEINVLASPMGTSTTPVNSVIKAKGDVGKVILLGNGANGGGTEGAKAGIVYRFLLQNLCKMGKDAVNAAASIGAGKAAPKMIVVGTVMADLNNYKVFLAKGWM